MSKTSSAANDRFWKGFWPAMAVLAAVLAFLFRDSFAPGMVHFSSDGPLGVLMSKSMETPGVFTGCWSDLSWLGDNGGANRILPTYLLLALLGPVGFAKFYPPLTLQLLGACAWVFFRTIRLSPGLCGVAALGAALNMNYFSNSCWGVGTRAMTLAAAFLALAALMNRRSGNRWLNAALAGVAVGIGVIEGADNGAIFSLFIAAFVVLQSFMEETTLARRVVSSLRVVVVGLCAMLVAWGTVNALLHLGTRTRAAAPAAAVATPAPTPEEKAADARRNWVFATQWSLSPAEMLRVIIPGIHGYRTDGAEGSEYWGRVGEYWDLPEGAQRRATRSSGAGEYAGLLVVLVGLWALFHARREGGLYDARERRYILLWAALLVPAVLLSWGYHAPFYSLVYKLPYFSTIRNPMKFMHAGHMCLMVLFGYGLLGLSRRCLETAFVPAASLGERLSRWKARALPVERTWFRLSVAAGAAGLLAFLLYANARGALTRHLQEIGFPNPDQAAAIARHSANEVGLFALFLLASVAVVTLIQIGVFAGPRRLGAVLALGTLLTLDLARANTPWVKHYDYREQYALNPVLEVLAREPWKQRVAAFPAGMIQQEQVARQILLANQVWRGQWLQWHAQFYNIQSLDMAQDPRPPFHKTNFIAHVSRQNMARLWELTNTRYLLGLAGGFTDQLLNGQLDPARRSFRVVMPFAFTQSPAGYIGVQTNDTGPWALIEFGAALPRARLYPQWQVSTNDDATLATLADPAWDPQRSVLVNDPVAASAAGDTNAPAGPVEFVSYAPKHIVLQATNAVRSILLLNDQHDRDWQVTVNGRPAALLRCNYVMRGVELPPGTHEVVFTFKPSLSGMWVTLVAMGFGVLGCLLLLVVRPPAEAPVRAGSEAGAEKASPGAGQA
ncbi:MAG: hypothetical protein RJA22_2727 [Verrucomicrobiota bacterium]